MRSARHPSFRESSSCFDVSLSFHPRKAGRLHPRHAFGSAAWSPLDELFRRVDHEDTRNDQRSSKRRRDSKDSLVYPIYPSFIRVALGNRAASNRSNNSDLVFCHFPKTVPSTLPSSPPSLLARPLSKRILRLPIPRDQPPQNNRLHVRDRSEQTCSRARAQGNQSARRSFQTVPSSHSELGKHACSPPTRFLRGLFFETFRLERDSAPTS